MARCYGQDYCGALDCERCHPDCNRLVDVACGCYPVHPEYVSVCKICECEVCDNCELCKGCSNIVKFVNHHVGHLVDSKTAIAVARMFWEVERDLLWDNVADGSWQQ